jgi:CRP-like cAMP-binding protein
MDWWVLEGLQPEVRRSLLSTLNRRTYRRGEVVFHEGDPAETLHLIVGGHLAAHVMSTSGDPVTVAVLGPGECVGELALVDANRQRAATVVALDRVETLSLTRAQFDRLRVEHRQLDQLLVMLLAARVDRLNRYLIEALFTSADRRVARRLLELCDAYRDELGQVVVPLTQDTLASLAGTTRPTTNQALQHLVRRGVLELRRGRVIVLDEAGLARSSGATRT